MRVTPTHVSLPRPLQETCTACADPNFRLDTITINLFQPFKPRFASKADWREVHRRMGKKGEYVAEYKLDGERLILHYESQTDRAQWWTRNCHDFTKHYGTAMAPLIAECMAPWVRDCVLDGEMMVWNQQSGGYAGFGENRSLSDHMRRLEAGYQPCYVVFDILRLNGENLATMTLSQRREKLQGVCRWKQHSMEMADAWVVKPNPDGTPPSKDHTAEVCSAHPTLGF